MFFEGSEKKLEVIIKSGTTDLRSWSRERIEELVATSEACILSSIHNDYCDAYLLSESSLFVWSDRLTMITCGQTTLAKAALKLNEWLSDDEVECLLYQRKNEYFPQMQKTDFHGDLKELNKVFDGEALRFGRADEHHLYMYELKKEYKPKDTDTTLEVLMYDLQGVAQEVFSAENQTKDEIHNKTRVHEILEGFQVDDFVFEPYGYSLNAIKDDYYFTIHITPQDSGPYVSFETNISTECAYQNVIHKVIETFKPMSYDVVFHSPEEIKDINVPGFIRRSLVKEKLNCGFNVQFAHFFSEGVKIQKAFKIEGN